MDNARIDKVLYCGKLHTDIQGIVDRAQYRYFDEVGSFPNIIELHSENIDKVNIHKHILMAKKVNNALDINQVVMYNTNSG